MSANSPLSEDAGPPMETDEQDKVDQEEIQEPEEDTLDMFGEIEGVDLQKMADDYAKYLIVNSEQDQTTLDNKIDGVYTRVDEFKQQLYFLHQNIASSSNKMQELHENTEQLLALFQKINQMEAFLNVVGRNVDQLEASVSQAEKDLEPSKIRKVFSSLQSLKRKRSPKPEPATNWNPPKVFRSKEYFSRGSTASPIPSSSPSSVINVSGQTDEHLLLTQQQEHGVVGQQDVPPS